MAEKTRTTSRILILILVAVVFGLCGLFGGAIGRPFLPAFMGSPDQPASQNPTPVYGIALPPVTPTAAAESTQAVEPTALMPVFSGSQSQDPADSSWPDGLWQTPVRCEEAFNEASSWLICEPGKPTIPPESLVFDILDVDQVYHVNLPEGGFTYLSLGQGTITADDVPLVLPGARGRNYLVVIRGRIDDKIVDSDLNITAEVTDFVVGHAIYTLLPPGAYVSHDWFRQQLVMSSTTGGTNCGATGCSTTRIVLFDVDSHFYQMFETHAGDIDSWTLLSEH